MLVGMTKKEDVNEVFTFINDNELSEFEDSYFFTLNLISSISYSRHQLYDNIILLLKKLPKITNPNQFYYTFRYLSNNAVMWRLNNLFCLLIDSNLISTDFAKTLNIICRNENVLLNAIQSDDVEKLQKIISNQNIDINEKFPLISPRYICNSKFMNLLEYSAYIGSINCFKFLWMNTDKTNINNLLKYSIAGGNMDIIHITESSVVQKELVKNKEKLLYQAILFMHNELIEYIIDSYDIEIDTEAYIKCIYASNYDAFIKIMKIDNKRSLKGYGLIGSTPLDIAAFEGNIIFFEYLYSLDRNMIYILNSYGKNVLHSATRNHQIGIIKFIIYNRLINPKKTDGYYLSPYKMALYIYNKDISKYIISIFDEYPNCFYDEDYKKMFYWKYDENDFNEDEKDYIDQKIMFNKKFYHHKSNKKSPIKRNKRKCDETKKIKYSWRKLI